MNVENTQVQMRKGILEFCILNIISRGEVYASDMLEELTSAKIMVVEGTLYPLLTRLKNAGLVEYKWVESVSGPPRKYYLLTDIGRAFLLELQITWDELVASTQLITAKGPRNGQASHPPTSVSEPPSLIPPDKVSSGINLTKESDNPNQI